MCPEVIITNIITSYFQSNYSALIVHIVLLQLKIKKTDSASNSALGQYFSFIRTI